jgi:hypothetical protein
MCCRFRESWEHLWNPTKAFSSRVRICYSLYLSANLYRFRSNGLRLDGEPSEASWPEQFGRIKQTHYLRRTAKHSQTPLPDPQCLSNGNSDVEPAWDPTSRLPDEDILKDKEAPLVRKRWFTWSLTWILISIRQFSFRQDSVQEFIEHACARSFWPTLSGGQPHQALWPNRCTSIYRTSWPRWPWWSICFLVGPPDWCASECKRSCRTFITFWPQCKVNFMCSTDWATLWWRGCRPQVQEKGEVSCHIDKLGRHRRPEMGRASRQSLLCRERLFTVKLRSSVGLAYWTFRNNRLYCCLFSYFYLRCAMSCFLGRWLLTRTSNNPLESAYVFPNRLQMLRLDHQHTLGFQ